PGTFHTERSWIRRLLELDRRSRHEPAHARRQRFALFGAGPVFDGAPAPPRAGLRRRGGHRRDSLLRGFFTSQAWSARTAAPRCDRAFHSSGESSATVFPTSGKKRRLS